MGGSEGWRDAPAEGCARATPPLLVRVGRWEGDYRVRSYRDG